MEFQEVIPSKPGALRISEETYEHFVREILEGLARNGFRNIIILNGHASFTRKAKAIRNSTRPKPTSTSTR
jgi:creatinine amidohydrolase/Fe(II)-dependent formamide hydrolase-like protein